MTEAGPVVVVPQAVDDVGRHVAHVLRDGVLLAEVLYAAWEEAAAIYEVRCADDAPDDAEAIAVDAFLATLPELPQQLTHAYVRRGATLDAYRRGPFAAGAFVSGTLRGDVLYYDALATMDAARWATLHEQPDAVVTLVADRDEDHRMDAASVTVAEARRRLDDTVWTSKLVFLRAMVQLPGVDPAVAAWSHLRALLDAHHAVRQFAAVQLCDHQKTWPDAPDVATLLRWLDDPLSALGEGRPTSAAPGVPWSASIGVCRARWAVAWILANRAQVSRGRAPFGEPAVEADAVAAALAATLPDAEDDARLAAAARADMLGSADAGLGERPRARLGEVARYLVHRQRVVDASGDVAHDKHYWLTQTVADLWPCAQASHAGSPTGDPAIAEALWAPSPGMDVVPCAPLPDGMRGPNPFAPAPSEDPRHAVDAGAVVPA